MLTVDPYFTPARYHIAIAHVLQQRYDQALRDYERSPDFPARMLWHKVLILFYRGDKTAAHELVNELRRKLPDDENVPSTYAILIAAEGKRAQAEEQIELAVRNGEHHRYHSFAE